MPPGNCLRSIDATRKLPEEYGGQKYPEDAASNPVIEENAEKMVNELLRRWRQ